MTTGSEIDYEALQQDAMRGVVRAVLSQIVKTGLPGDHHFYISFLTQSPGVILSKRLKEKYPHEMTIVLQHRFWDLIVSEDRFEVKLTFDGVPERLVVPYRSIKVFIDPSVRFGLQFEDASSDRETPAPRRSMTMDAAYDSVGEARADSPRATLSKKPRPTRKPKTDKDGAPAQVATATPPALPTTPAAPTPQVITSATSETPKPTLVADTATAAPEGGAKILSLDQFRKK
jgi:uncharacterized protein